MNNGLKLIPKLILEHVQRHPKCIMKFQLAAQVLSVSTILGNYHHDAAHVIAKFCKFMHYVNAFRLFICINKYKGNPKKR